MRNEDVERALRTLDRSTQEEARMAAAELMKITHAVDDGVKRRIDRVNRSSSSPKSLLLGFEGSGNRHRDPAPRWPPNMAFSPQSIHQS
jgi:hypothetical protein